MIASDPFKFAATLASFGEKASEYISYYITGTGNSHYNLNDYL